MPKSPLYSQNQEAIAALSKKLALPAASTAKLEAEYHEFAYVVANLSKADLVADVRWLVIRAEREGTGFEEFKRQFYRLVYRKGWRPPQLKNPESKEANNFLRIKFETPIRRALAGGREKQMRSPELLNRMPGRVWRWRDSPQPRPHHQALHNKVFRADHPFWDTAAPPCGFGCRCTSMLVSQTTLDREGWKIEEPPDPKTIADPGFRRAPGITPDSERQAVLDRGLSRHSPTIQQKVKEAMARSTKPQQ